MLAAGCCVARQKGGISFPLTRGRNVGVHIQGVQTHGSGTANIRAAVVANHQTLGYVQTMFFDQCLEETLIRLAAAVVGRNVNGIELVIQTQTAQLVGGEHPLGVAE